MDAKLNIIVVEDHDALREMTVEALCDQGHYAVGVDSAEALPDWLGMPPDVMVIDLNLPGEDGISLAQRVRAAQASIGIIMLTARSQVAEKTRGYKSGADIYLTKPTSIEELSAALQSLARRLKTAAVPGEGSTDVLILDTAHLTLKSNRAQVALTAQEATLLVAFLSAPGHRLENLRINQLLGRSDASFKKATQEVQIARLRKKLRQAGASVKPIQALREVGYQLCEVIQVV
jgi:DNA-binding response OmpR family regulator